MMRRWLTTLCPKCPLFVSEIPGWERFDIGLLMAEHVGKAHPEMLEDDGEELRKMHERIAMRRN